MSSKIIFGRLSETITACYAYVIVIFIQVVGLVFIIVAGGGWFAWLALMTFGLGMGGIVPLWGSMLGATYGRHVFGRAMGLMHPFMLPIHTLGVPFAGWVYDTYGNYDLAFKTFVFVYFIAGGALFFVRVPKIEPGTEPAPAEAA